MSVESESEETESRGTPLGVVLIAILTGLYGVTWLLGVAVSRQANVWTALGPGIGLSALALAVGMWMRHPFAWGLTLGVYAVGTIWTVTDVLAGNSNRLPAVVTGILVVCYLVVRRGLFVHSVTTESENAQ